MRGRGDSDLFSFNQVTLRVSLVMSRVVLVGSFNCAGRSQRRSEPFPADDLKNSRRGRGSARRAPAAPPRLGAAPAAPARPGPGARSPLRGPSPAPPRPGSPHLFGGIAKLDLTHRGCAVKEADPFRSYRKP